MSDTLLSDAPAEAPAAPPAGVVDPTVPPAAVEPAATTTEAEKTVTPTAPEEYAEFSAPEGVQLDGEVTGEFKALAKGLNLPQEAAQKIVDLGAKMAQRAAEAQATQAQATISAWAEESKADKEFGGPKLAESLSVAKAALNATASPALRDLLTNSGLGNHPEVIRHFIKIAPAFLEDRPVTGSRAPAGSTQSTAQVLYPSTPKSTT
jgi:hypothetical protein